MKHLFCLLLPLFILFSQYSYGKGGGAGAIFIAASHSHKTPFDELKGEKYTGYVVYKADTLRGLVSFKWRMVIVEDELHNVIAKHDDDNKHTHDILITNSKGQTIRLVKFKNFSGKYYRVVHEGKLSMYDRHFVFSTSPDDVHLDDMCIAYDGQVRQLNSFWTTSTKKRFFEVVNHVYGTSYDPKKMKRNELMALVLKSN